MSRHRRPRLRVLWAALSRDGRLYMRGIVGDLPAVFVYRRQAEAWARTNLAERPQIVRFERRAGGHP